MRRARLAMLSAALLAGASDVRADPCFWVRGRLSAFNGAPTFRIRPAGSRRVLGVRRSAEADAAIADLPPEVRQRVQPDAFQVTLRGDFEVCPLAEDRPGRMRPVLLRQARHLSSGPASP